MDLPSLPQVHEIVARYARILERLNEEIGERPLVLPNGRFFPDAFSADAASLDRFAKRMALHAGMSDIPITAIPVPDEPSPEQASNGHCSSGACSAFSGSRGELGIADNGNGWVISVPELELRFPVALATRLSRALGAIFLEETRDESEALEAPLSVTVELSATALGFGVLLLEGSYIYSKSCGGPSIAQLTELSCAELALAFALFACRGQHARSAALKELGATQRALAEQALDLIDSNAQVIRALKEAPEQLALGAFELGEAKPSLVRLFSRAGKSRSREADDLAALERSLRAQVLTKPRAPEDPRRAELRALVDEALDERATATE